MCVYNRTRQTVKPEPTDLIEAGPDRPLLFATRVYNGKKNQGVGNRVTEIRGYFRVKGLRDVYRFGRPVGCWIGFRASAVSVLCLHND